MRPRPHTYNISKQAYIDKTSQRIKILIRRIQSLFFQFARKLFDFVSKIYLVKYETNTFFDVNHHKFAKIIGRFRAYRKKYNKTIVRVEGK